MDCLRERCASNAPLRISPKMFPNSSLQNLAHVAARKLRPDRDAFRRLDAPETRLAHRDDVAFVDRLSGLEFDHRRDGLAPFVVGDTDDGAILHGRVRPDDLLDLP